MTKTGRPFSLGKYLLLVFALSWPFQIAYALWGRGPTASYLLSSLSMIMVTVATFIAGRFIFQDGFKGAGWRWGRPKHYAWTFGLALLIFAAPTLVEALLGLRPLPGVAVLPALLGSFALRFLLTLAPGFGEEFGWRGYMLPRLARRYSVRKALLLHGLIWWAWHLPALVAIGAQVGGGAVSVGVSIAVTLLVSLVPATMNAIVYAYVWAASRSLAVASAYHSAYDEVRDAIEKTIGLGPLASPWEMLVTTLLGAFLLWKGNWQALEADR